MAFTCINQILLVHDDTRSIGITVLTRHGSTIQSKVERA